MPLCRLSDTQRPARVGIFMFYFQLTSLGLLDEPLALSPGEAGPLHWPDGSSHAFVSPESQTPRKKAGRVRGSSVLGPQGLPWACQGADGATSFSPALQHRRGGELGGGLPVLSCLGLPTTLLNLRFI